MSVEFGNDYQIPYDRDLLIFGEPILIPGIGYARFLTYKEYLLSIHELSIIKMNTLHVYYLYRSQFDMKNENLKEAVEELKKEKIYNIVLSEQQFIDAYLKIFSLVLDENSKKDIWLDTIKFPLSEENSEPDGDLLLMKALELIFSNEHLFMAMRKLVLDMNMLVEDVVSPNPEVQEGIETSRTLKSQDSGVLTTTDIVTSIVAGTSNSFLDVCHMTVLQVNGMFSRIGAFKNYDANLLFRSAGAEVKDMGSWCQNIDLFANKEVYGIKKKDFENKYGGLLK